MMRNALSLLAAVLAVSIAAACTKIDYSALTRSLEASYATATPRFGDSDPVHEWEGGAPFGLPVHGIDVSKWQGEIDWKAVRRAGIEFAFIKATEGGDRLDETFMRNWHDAGRAGVPRSGYHFFYFCTSAERQARWFIRNVPRDRTALPHVLDVEWNHKSPTCRFRPPPGTVRAEMTVFLDTLERHYGKRPIIYTTIAFHRDNLEGHMKDEVFWLRSVKAHPRVVYAGRDFTFWQYTGTGRVPGIGGDTDINVFAGDRAQWQQWLDAATN
ncbi:MULTISPECIES: GH25 family lysozyme [unclassified Roseitalea]|uniref:glycoside hydrolase family 25 protein n=1 Tax=unclassified Roseitalea TaxID=2639107 RepID=UPI00273E4D9C|nr:MULTISPECIES: GH25 family lysozyme [unclassified Roseitalea]